MKNLLIALGLTVVLTSGYAQSETKKEPAKKPAMPTVEVQRPCKDGQTPEKDKCREPKKVEKKK